MTNGATSSQTQFTDSVTAFQRCAAELLLVGAKKRSSRMCMCFDRYGVTQLHRETVLRRGRAKFQRREQERCRVAS